MSKILVVEDDLFFREAIVSLLEKKGMNVEEAANGKIAQEKMEKENFSVVLSDVQMPVMNGVELLEWSQKNKPIPFIMMTGFSALLEVQSAIALGAKDFIAKPFRNKELLEAISKVLSPTGNKDRDKSEAEAEDFCSVNVEDFRMHRSVDFDVYIRYNEKNYIKVAHEGDGLSPDQVNHYAEKGVSNLFVRQEAFGKLVDFLPEFPEITKDQDDLFQQRRNNFLKYTDLVIREKAFSVQADVQSYSAGAAFMSIALATVFREKNYLNLLIELHSHSNITYEQSVLTALYSVMTARKIGITSSHTLFRLFLAGLYGDIGKREVSLNLLKKKTSEMSAEEQRAFEKHAPRSPEILGKLPAMPTEVGRIVGEWPGYGEGSLPKGAELHPLAKILRAVHFFVEFTAPIISEEGDVDGHSATQVIDHMEKDTVGYFDQRVLKVLRSIFKVVA